MDNIKKLYKGSRLIETIKNYSLVDKSDQVEEIEEGLIEDDHFYTDKEFWSTITSNPEASIGNRFNLYYFVVSNWVARVPGLFWTDNSQLLRREAKSNIAFKSNDWVEFYPPGKSKKVMGGIGTIRLSPSESGSVLLSVSAGCNASSGIPILVFPDVMDQLNLRQGDAVCISGAKWHPMSVQWASSFASTKDIPRGYLVVDTINKIQIIDRDYPVTYHPFSLMEYQSEDALLYDFVYVTADTKVESSKKKIEMFFENYAKKEGRNGEYLLNPDMISPIFESRYMSPSELNEPSQKANVELLYERIRNAQFNNASIEQLVLKLPKYYDSSSSARTLAKNVGLNVSLIADGPPVSILAQIIQKSIENELIESLIDRVIFEYPQIFK